MIRSPLRLLAVLVLTLGFLALDAATVSAETHDQIVLEPGESVTSPNGAHVLVHQHDGNVVLYAYGSKAIWHTQTHGRDTSHLVFQGDGNLVLYGEGRALWHTGTYGKGEALAVQDDANVVVYAPDKPVWAIRGMEPPSYPVPAQLRRIAWCEAGKYIGLPKYQTNYRAYNQQGSSASGGYQILDGTWASWKQYVPAAKPYARAAHAPPHVQDEVATKAYYRHGSSPWNASRSCWG